MRHTNFVQGAMSTTGQLMRLATTLDVTGANASFIHRATYGEIEAQRPRLGFNEHFAALMELEMAVKAGDHRLVAHHRRAAGVRLLREDQREPVHARDRRCMVEAVSESGYAYAVQCMGSS